MLRRAGLVAILEGYGKPYATGSYVLDLMTWRDLDLYLAVEEFDRRAFFALGYALSEALKPYRMTFRDELAGETPGLPAGWYWGVHTRLIPESDWKVDLWVLKSDQVAALTAEVEKVSARLTPETRQAILAIKAEVCESPEYRRSVKSMDIYDAVIAGGISTTEEFWSWVSAREEVSPRGGEKGPSFRRLRDRQSPR